MEVDERSIEECAKALKDCMEKAFPAFSTKFPVKLSSGKSWGSMRPFSI
jgi:DNA polymerase I-like protein with 3'-5' exonuclease and polymerase domains